MFNDIMQKYLSLSLRLAHFKAPLKNVQKKNKSTVNALISTD
jgi:hypothetical protein